MEGDDENSYQDSDLFYDDSEDDASGDHVYDASKPFVVELEYEDGRERVYEPVFDMEETEYPPASRYFKPKFVLPNNADATASTLLEAYLPDKLLDAWVKCTNDYAKARLPAYKCREVTRRDLLHFVAAVAYMGVVVLPFKGDYFVRASDTGIDSNGSIPSVLPHHPAIQIKWLMFQYIWDNFHTSFRPNTTSDRASTQLDAAGDDDDDEEYEEDDYLEYSYAQDEEGRNEGRNGYFHPRRVPHQDDGNHTEEGDSDGDDTEDDDVVQ